MNKLSGRVKRFTMGIGVKLRSAGPLLCFPRLLPEIFADFLAAFFPAEDLITD